MAVAAGDDGGSGMGATAGDSDGTASRGLGSALAGDFGAGAGGDWSLGDGFGMGARSATEEAASKFSFTARNQSQQQMRINFRVPGYTAYLDDGTKVHLEAKDHVVDVYGYSMANLLADLGNKTKWGICQAPALWYWDIEKNGFLGVVTNDDLKKVLQKFESTKHVSLVVEFPIKPIYKSSMSFESKLEKLPVRRIPNALTETSSSAESDEESGEEIEENVDPSWMEDDDIFMDDQEVFVSLSLRAEEEAARMNLGHEPEFEPEITVDDFAEIEPRFVLDKKNPKIKKCETFPSMGDFRIALRQYCILKKFQVHRAVTDKKRYRAECKAPGCPLRIVANRLVGQSTVEISMIPDEHDCMSTEKVVSKIATQSWVAERVVTWLRKKPSLGAADLQDKLLEKYGVEIAYTTVWAGKQKALDSIYASWEDSFQKLFPFMAELLRVSLE